jgi:ADP-ribosyl-[dinitrogen reductase] hydrolase
MEERTRRIHGVLLGGAVGDSLGLPGEGISPGRQRRLWPGDLRHRFLFGRGMISDDTEHAFMTAQALLEADGDMERFRSSLAWKLRWWFLALPAGVGLATARACIRLWMGVPPDRAGVHSAGNGPAMRSAVLGAVFAREPEKRREFVRVSTRLTHLDPRAETAALAVAEGAAWIVRGEPSIEDFSGRLPGLGADAEWTRLCRRLTEALARRESVADFAVSLDLVRGVSGYAYHTVPMALFAWMRHRGDFRDTLTSAIRCGGDTDTVGAIAGALAGCEVGVDGIPDPWRNHLRDWPRTPALLGLLAKDLARPGGRPVRWCWPGLVPRNLFFLVVVLFHGFRRLLPPY